MTDHAAIASARLATRLAFFVAGFAMACCAPLFPYIKESIGADEARFGMVLLCLGLGSLIAMPVTGLIAARYGARSIIIVAGFGLALFLPFLVFAPSAVMLAASLFCFGASLGSIDVAMNIHAVQVQALGDKPLMSNFHAQFSIGGVVGAGLVTFLLSQGLDPKTTVLFGAALTLVAVLWARGGLLSHRSETPEPFALPKGIVILLSLLAATLFLIEGAILDWGAILLIDRELAPKKDAGIGYILFSIAMVAGRLTGDRMIAGLGELPVLIGGGMASFVGIALVLVSGHNLLAYAGFLFIGFGAANLVPIFFSAAGRQTLMPQGLAIAAVTTTGYAGILIGPAMIGFIANMTSLSHAFWLLAVLSLAIPLTARAVSKI